MKYKMLCKGGRLYSVISFSSFFANTFMISKTFYKFYQLLYEHFRNPKLLFSIIVYHFYKNMYIFLEILQGKVCKLRLFMHNKYPPA